LFELVTQGNCTADDAVTEALNWDCQEIRLVLTVLG